MPKIFEYSQKQIDELVENYHTIKDAKASRRIQVVMLRAQNVKLKQVVEITHFSSDSITRLCKKYREEGINSLITTKYTSHYQYMTFEEEAEFLEAFREKAELGEIVTAKDMHEAYQKQVGHSTTFSGFHYLLKRHGWRKVMPRPHHPKQADAETIASTKKLTQKSKL